MRSSSPVVVVTGSTGGIGTATVAAFRATGWTVIGVDRHPGRDGAAPDAFLQLDVSRVDDMASLFATVEDRFGRLDAIVNGAALQICRDVISTSVEDWDRVMNTNARSVFLSIKHGAPLLERQGGAIVNVGSVHGVATSAGIAAYAASKGALNALTRAAAIELAPRGIRVNAVLPGAIDTPMLRDGLRRAADGADAAFARLRDRHLMNRVGSPEEVAESILFLADGKRSGFVTGQTLTVDGGATARLSTE